MSPRSRVAAESAIASFDAGDPDKPWPWEGRVQERFAQVITAKGWTVTRFARTRSDKGIDVVAEKGERLLVVEVKGFPSSTLAVGPDKGKPKPGGTVAKQIPTWFGKAVMAALQQREAQPEAESLVVLPEHEAFRREAAKVANVLAEARVHVVFVGEDGQLDCGTWQA